MRREAKLRDLTLVFGGILAHNNGGATTADNSGAPYLRDVYERGLHGQANWDGVRRALGSYPLDAVGQHPYVDQGGACTGDHIRAYLGWLHGTIEDDEGRCSAKPLYVTEVAWSTTMVSPEVQATNLGMLYDACAQTPYVAARLWFELLDNPFAQLYYGVLDPHWTRKPAFAAFQRIAAPR